MPFEPRFRTLIEIFDHSIQAFANRPLFGTKRYGSWSWMTYRDFGEVVTKVRNGLAALGVGHGDAVAVIANNRVEWAVCAYATFGLGAIYVPMYEAQQPKEWEFIAKDCRAKVLVVANSTILSKAKGFLETVPTLNHIVSLEPVTNGSSANAQIVEYDALLSSTFKAPPVKVAPEDVAGFIYTSGTTGMPKGVVLTHSNLACNVSAGLDVFPIDDADRSLSFLPWAHSFGQVVELHCVFAAGGSMAIAESVEKILDNLAEVKPTVLMSVPRIFNKIYTAVQAQIAAKPPAVQMLVKRALRVTAKERAGKRLGLRELALLKAVDRIVFAKVRARFGGNLKYAFSGGAAISREVAEFIDSLGIVVYEGYGLTETSPISTANVPGQRRIGSVGRPLPGIRVDIDPATAEKRPAEPGKPARLEGEIVVYGHNVMKEYFNRPEETKAVFTADGGFRTGDMGYLDPLGYLYITGRIKEQYKLENGKYVVPTPLEEAIKLSPYILNAMVYGDNRPYNIALVAVNVPAVKTWAQTHGVPALDTEALLKHPSVRSLVRGEIDGNSKAFKGFESVKEVALVAEDFTVDNGMLTPSMKLKRRKVVEVYGKLINDLYASAQTQQPRMSATN